MLLCVCVFFSKRVVVEGPNAKDQEDQDEGGDNMMMMMMMMMMSDDDDDWRERF